MTGQGDNYTTGCLLHYIYFKNYYKDIAIDLSKQQVLEADPKAIQQIMFTGNVDRAGNTTIFSLLKKQGNHFIFFEKNFQSIVNVFSNLFCFNIK